MIARRVVVTGAAGQIGYAIVPLIARGNMLGPDQHVELMLLEIEPAMKSLEAVRAELQDCFFPLLDRVVITADPKVAFAGCDYAILCGSAPRKGGMERRDLLAMNANIFSAQGAVMAEVGNPDVRVCVVGNPANTNALLFLKATNGKVKPENVTAMTRLDHNRSLAIIAEKSGAAAAEVRNACVWGNHSSTQVPDVTNATTKGQPVREAVKDDAYWDGGFIKQVQGRGGEIIKLRGLSSAMSAAKAAVDHVHDWVLGTAEGTFVSMAVYSTGNPYGVPDDLIFSFPCSCAAGKWSIVPGLPQSDVVKGLIQETIKELQDEKAAAGL